MISPGGRYVLLSLRETLPGGENRNYTEVYDVKQKRTILSEPAGRSQLNWMPKQELLYFVTDSEDGRSVVTLDPLTSESKIIAQGLPKENFHIAPDEKSLFFSAKETLTISNPGGLKRLIGIDDRQSHTVNAISSIVISSHRSYPAAHLRKTNRLAQRCDR